MPAFTPSLEKHNESASDDLEEVAATLSERGGEEEMAREIEGHLEMQVEDNLRLGMAPDEARRAAVLKFGDIEPAK